MCESHYFDDGSNANCVACLHPCTECSGAEDTCTECHTDPNRNDVPVCDCVSGRYEESDLSC